MTRAGGACPHWAIHVIVRSAGVPPVSIHVIVRSAGVPPVSISNDRELRMFGMSAERSVAQRPPRIDSGGTPPLRSLCIRKEAL